MDWELLELLFILGPYLLGAFIAAFGGAVLIYAVIMRGYTGRWPWPLEFLNQWGV